MLKRAAVIAAGLAFAGLMAWGFSGNVAAVEIPQFISRSLEIRGQPKPEDYQAWLKADPKEAERLTRFEAYLKSKGVAGVLPIEQVVRSDTDWRRCKYPAYEVAPEADWPHIVTTLSFIRDHVVPAVGQVEVVSGYRAPTFNTCVGGASRSAHRDFWALDLVPVSLDLSRKDLIKKVCLVHRKYGRDYNTGLGFYNGVRFHIDSKSYRRWGADRKGASSPCDSSLG